MHDNFGKILVEIACEHVREIGTTIPAALSVGSPKQFAFDGIHRYLTEKGPCDLWRERKEQDRAALADATQIGEYLPVKCALRTRLRKYGL